MIARLVWPRVKFSEAEREGLRDLVVRPPKLVLPALQVFSTEISTHVVRILRVKMALWHIWPPAIFIRSYLRTLHIFFEEGNKKARICRDKENYWRKGNIIIYEGPDRGTERGIVWLYSFVRAWHDIDAVTISNAIIIDRFHSFLDWQKLIGQKLLTSNEGTFILVVTFMRPLVAGGWVDGR